MYIQESLSTRYFDRRTEYKAPMVEHQRVWKNKFNWSLHCVQLCNRMNERGECARIGGRISLLPRFPSFGWYKQRSSSACCVTSCLSVSHAGKRRGGEMCVCVCVCWTVGVRTPTRCAISPIGCPSDQWRHFRTDPEQVCCSFALVLTPACS